MKKNESICQSCGLPLTRNTYGLNANFTTSKEYCKFCYNNGHFTSPNLTLEQQILKLTEMAVQKFGSTKDEAKRLATTILPTLKRWQ